VKRWLKYVREEYGHQEWVLDDIRACGGDAESVRHGAPALATDRRWWPTPGTR